MQLFISEAARLDIRIGKNISLVQKMADHYINESLHPFSLNKSQMEVLLLLKRRDGRSQAELNEHLLFNKASVTKLLAGLEKSGYIRRCSCCSDKRKNEVHLTKKAEAVFPAIHKPISSWENMLTAGLSEDEQETFKYLIEKIRKKILDEGRH
jgi:DNA-binding MarR family transcriptional regulator